MNLSIREAATLLKRSERTLRDQVKRGVIRARKVNNKWVIREADLPLSEDRRLARRAQADAVRGAVEKALHRRNPPMTIEDMEAFRAGRAVYFGVVDSRPDVAEVLREGLAQLGIGQHQFEPGTKLAAFRRARAQFARAAAWLRLLPPEDDAARADADTLEADVMPRIGGIMHAIEQRARR